MSYKRGHCKGTRSVTRKAQSWYDIHSEETLAYIEAQKQQGYVLAMAKANLPYAAHERQDVRAALAAEVQFSSHPTAA